MTVSCTITKDGRFDEYGRPLTVAQSYTGTYDFVKSLVRSGYASVTSESVFDDDNNPTNGVPVFGNVNPLTEVIELWAAGEQVTAGGGGISPDATGTLAGRSAHNAEAVGFVYLATDQVPAEYYFREGAAGNWSPAVEVQGPTGATGATGPAGATGTAGADGVTFVSGTTAPDNGDGRPNGTVYVRYTA